MYLLLPAIPVGLALSLTSFSGDECDYPGGSPAGYTGSPGDGQDCTACHGGTSAPVPGWITSDIPAEGYTPDSTYTLTVTVTGSGKKGFEVSPQDPAGNQLGVLVAGPGTELKEGTKYVTQSSSLTSNPATWTFEWTAPAAGTGEVTFYGASAVTESVTKTSSLTVAEYTGNPTGIKDPAVSREFTVYPNPTNGPLYIRGTAEMKTTVPLKLFSAGGKLLLNINITRAGTGERILDLTGFPEGVYLLEIGEKGRSVIQKVIKK